jgi:outer membrane protein assembly factor BamB
VATLRPFGLAVVTFALGCAGVRLGSRGHFERSGVEPPALNELAGLRWRVPLVAFSDLEPRSRTRATPVYDPTAGVLYVGSLDRGVYAIRAVDGAVLWRFQTLGGVEGTPTLHNGTLYIGSGDGALYALNASDGSMRWRFATVAEIVHAPLVDGDSVFVVNGDDTVFSVNRANGEQRWRYRREPPGGITGGGHAGLLHARNRLYTGFADGHIVALDPAEGGVVWERDTGVDSEGADGANEAHRTIDVDTTPVLADGNLFAASYTAGLYALDPDSGSVRWRVDRLLNVSAIVGDGRYLYVTSANSGLVKVSPADGEILWARDLGARALAAPVVRGGYLFVSSAEAAVWVLRAADGEAVEGIGREGVSAPPVVTASHLFFQSNRGVFQAWRFARADD